MRFAAHVNSDTYRRSYQTAMPMVDGQASYFRFDASSSELHDLRRSYGWRRNPYYQPKLKEATRLIARSRSQGDHDEETATQEASPTDAKERQKEYDQWRHQQHVLIREQNRVTATSVLDEHIYESDFSQTRKLMPERDRLATMLFHEGSLRDVVGQTIMNDLVVLCRSQMQRTYCDGLNASGRMCDTCLAQCAVGDEHKWWSHVYHCRKNRRISTGDFAEFCFLCIEWYEDKHIWTQHIKMHADHPPL